MEIKAAIFDVDGTLVDSVDFHAHAWREVLAEFGKEVAFDHVRSQIGKGSDTLLPVYFSEEELKRVKQDISERRDAIFKNKYLLRVKPFPQVRDLFERLRTDGVKIALASSGKEEEIEYYQKLLNVKDVVQVVTTSDDAAKSKPHPDIFQAAVKKLGHLPVEACVAIGDTPYDAAAAGKLGLRTIGVLCGGFPGESLRQAGAVAVYRDPADLLVSYGMTPLRGVVPPAHA